MGAEIVEVHPAYLSVCRARARDRAKELGSYIRWQPDLALKDTIRQCENIPQVRRIVVPTGSGLTCAGILIGLTLMERTDVEVIAVAVSGMANQETIITTARKYVFMMALPDLTVVKVDSKYEDYKAEILPDGTPLDPYYSAKALQYIRPGDCLWIPGLRPLLAMPEKCRAEIQQKQQDKMVCLS